MIKFIELTKSELRKKLLQYFFTHPDVSLYLREIAAIIDVDAGNLSKELCRFEKEGFFVADKKGNQKYFSLNKNYPLFNELKSIIFKTLGVKGALENILKETDGVTFAFLYGSYAKDKENAASDIDLMLIIDQGAFNIDIFEEKMHELGRRLSREINYTYYSENEWHDKIKKRDSFLCNVLKQSKTMLVGNKNGLQRFSKRR